MQSGFFGNIICLVIINRIFYCNIISFKEALPQTLKIYLNIIFLCPLGSSLSISSGFLFFLFSPKKINKKLKYQNGSMTEIYGFAMQDMRKGQTMRSFGYLQNKLYFMFTKFLVTITDFYCTF